MRIEREKIIINGEDTLIFGAELHYFRVPKHEWKSRIEDAKEAGVNMISTYVPWKVHEYKEGYIDLTGETIAERDFQSFLQLVSDEGLYCLVRPGPYVMAEIADHGIPTWFIENYPEAVALTEDGEPHRTRVVSYMHPTYLEKVEKWYQTVCSVIKPFEVGEGGPVIMFQLDNEVGMFHWVTNQGDYNEVTKKQFIKYLENKPTQLDTHDMDELFETMKEDPETQTSSVLKNEYFLFMREHYRIYLEHVKQLAEQNDISVPFVINIHGFHTIDYLKRGTKYPIGVSQLLEAAKMEDTLVAGDYYIGNIEFDNYVDVVLANAFTKAVQPKDQPLFSAEFQSGSVSEKPRLQPSTFDLTTRLCFANGMNAVNYYMFVGGENYENIGLNGRRHEWQAPLSASGEKKPHFPVIQHLGKMYHTFERSLLNAKQTAQTCLAFYPDYYMTQYSKKFSPRIETFQNERDLNLYNGVGKGLRANNIVFDSLNIQSDDRINVAEIPSLWMFSMEWMDQKVQQKLVDYLEDGGQLVLFPTVPTKDMNDRDCTLLQDYMDVRQKGRRSGFVTVGEIDSVKTHYIETFEVESGAFAWSEDEQRDVVAFEKQVGKGKAVVFGLGMELDYDYKYDVIRELAERVNVTTEFTLEEELDVSIRAISDNRYFVFLHNFDEYKKVTTVNRDHEPLFGNHPITVQPKSGLMLPVNIPLTEEINLLYGTAEVFHIDNFENALSMKVKVKLKQAKEELVFQTEKWKPVENSIVKVDRKENDWKVEVLPSLKEEVTIDFIQS